METLIPGLRKNNHEWELLVIHPNGEGKWLVIESWGERWICVRWPIAGQYDIMLKDGRMVARNPKTRLRNLYNPWKAANLADCKNFVASKLGISKEEMEERFKKHNESMPRKIK